MFNHRPQRIACLSVSFGVIRKETNEECFMGASERIR